MPTLPHALLDIAETYRGFLTQKLDLTSFWNLSNQLRPTWQPEYHRNEMIEQTQLKITTGPDTFDKLRWAATRALWAIENTPEGNRYFDHSERIILIRIRRNSDQLKNIIYDLRRDRMWKVWLDDEKARLDLLDDNIRYLKMGKPPVKYATTVRKIWDVGVESVLMQTIVQVDGDVITRVQAGMDANKQKLILATHQSGLDLSLKYWQTLFDIVKQIAGSLTKLFLPG
jgi:hypothetical protein